jgi:hypothetical protein
MSERQKKQVSVKIFISSRDEQGFPLHSQNSKRIHIVEILLKNIFVVRPKSKKRYWDINTY